MPPRRVTLLARRASVRLQNLVDERRHRAQLRLGPLRVAMQRRQRALHRLAHHPAMNAELRGHTLHRADAELMLPAKLLEQIHLGSPVHTRPPDPIRATVG